MYLVSFGYESPPRTGAQAPWDERLEAIHHHPTKPPRPRNVLTCLVMRVPNEEEEADKSPAKGAKKK